MESLGAGPLTCRGEALIANTAVATRTDQEEARELLCKLSAFSLENPSLPVPRVVWFLDVFGWVNVACT